MMRLMAFECFHLPTWSRAVEMLDTDTDTAQMRMSNLSRRAQTVCKAYRDAGQSGLVPWVIGESNVFVDSQTSLFCSML